LIRPLQDLKFKESGTIAAEKVHGHHELGCHQCLLQAVLKTLNSTLILAGLLICSTASGATVLHDATNTWIRNGGGLSNLSSERINVRDFGVVQDIYTNNHAALQAALDSGLPLFIPPGFYRVNATLLATNKSVDISAAGARIYPGQSMTNLLEVASANGNGNTCAVLIKGLNLIAVNQENGRIAATNGIVLGSADGVRQIVFGKMENMSISGFPNFGVVLNSIQGMSFDHCSIHSNGSGVHYTAAGYIYDTTWHDCRVEYNSTNGFYVENGYLINIHSCFFRFVSRICG